MKTTYHTILLLSILILGIASCKKEEPINNTDNTNNTTIDFTLTSDAVVNGEILDDYKCEIPDSNGVQNSIPLSWSNAPDNAGSLAIIMEHYPNPNDSTNANCYLILWNIDPSVTEIPYGTANDGPWYIGSNKDGDAISYTSPCSPTSATHEYTITLYALDQVPSSLPDSSSLTVDRTVFLNAISSVTIVDKAVLTFNSVD